MHFHGDPIRASSAKALLAALVGLILTTVASSPVHAPTARAGEPFARGKPLTEWVSQASHYIPELRREAVRAIAAVGPTASAALPRPRRPPSLSPCRLRCN